MTNGKFKDQINKSCSARNWDQGNDTHEPNDQAMGGGVSTVKQKCNAATNAQAGADNVANTVEKKAGGVVNMVKNRAEEFFNTDFDRDGTVGEGMGNMDSSPHGLQDPDVEHGTRSAYDGAADKRIPTAVGF